MGSEMMPPSAAGKGARGDQGRRCFSRRGDTPSVLLLPPRRLPPNSACRLCVPRQLTRRHDRKAHNPRGGSAETATGVARSENGDSLAIVGSFGPTRHARVETAVTAASARGERPTHLVGPSSRRTAKTRSLRPLTSPPRRRAWYAARRPPACYPGRRAGLPERRAFGNLRSSTRRRSLVDRRFPMRWAP